MTRLLFGLCLIITGLALFSSLRISAQGPVPLPSSSTAQSSVSESHADPDSKHIGPEPVHTQDLRTEVPLGNPGTSFRFVRSFGTLDQPYVPDNAHLNFPWGITTDGANVWIAESFGRRLLKFSHDGSFITAIGNAGLDRYKEQSVGWFADVAVDGQGNIWTADSNAGNLLKFDSNGNFVSKLGQTYQNGSGNNAFGQAGPASVAFDSAGNIYVSDGVQWWSTSVGNHRVQIFDSSGTYLNTIGTPGVAGQNNNQFQGPRHITISANVLYVTDGGNHRIQIYDISNPQAPAYIATIGIVGEAGNENNHLNDPSGVAVDTNYIYVADTRNHRVQVFNRTTRAYVATIGGTAGSGNDQFRFPSDVAVDTAGNIYVADMANLRVQQFNQERVYVRSYGVTGVPYLTDGSHYNNPYGLAIGLDESIYLTEFNGQRLIKLNAAGDLLWSVGAAGVKNDWFDILDDRFNNPADLALAADGRIFVADKWHARVQIFSTNGELSGKVVGPYGPQNDGFNCPDGVFVANNGSLYVADTCNQRVQIFDSGLNYVATIGVTGQTGNDNAHFNNPTDVAVDSQGTIFVADQFNHRVQVFDSNRNYLRTIGQTGVQASDFSSLSGPSRLFVDAKDHLYIADTWNNRVQVFDDNGAYLTTIAGSWGSGSGQLRGATGIAVGKMGNVFVSDANNHRIQEYALGIPGWAQRNINGFGDITNSNLHALAPFKGALYAGTYNGAGNGAQLWRMSVNGGWTETAEAGFGITRSISINHLLPFKDQLYAGVRNEFDGGLIYRSSNGSNWSPVVTEGFGDPNTSGIYRLAEFKGHLYAGTSVFTDTHGAEIWRSTSGDSNSWERVVENGFDDTNHHIIRSSEVYSGYLYFGTQNIDTSDYMATTGAIIIRSDTGDAGSWTKVSLNGFGDIENFSITGLASFNGYLYASTARWSQGGIEIWRCQSCDEPGSWEQVVDNGFGNFRNWGISTLQVFNGSLYLVVGNPLEGMQVWRTETGNSGQWVQIGDRGFGKGNNTAPYYNNVTIFDGHLYIGTENSTNGAEVWQYKDATLERISAADGGILYNDENGIRISFPSNAVTTTLDLSFTKWQTPSQALPQDMISLRLFTLVGRDADGNEITQFSKEYTIEFSYTDAELEAAFIDEDTLVCMYLDNLDNQWKPIQSSPNPAGNKVTCSVDHFTEFALAADMPTVAPGAYLPLLSR